MSHPGSNLPKFYYKLRRLCLLQITRRGVVTVYYKLRESCYKLRQVQLYYSRRQHYNRLCRNRRALSFLLYFGSRVFPLIYIRSVLIRYISSNFMVIRKVTAIGCLLYILTQSLYIFEFFVLCVIVCPSELFLSLDLSQNRTQNS